MVVGSQDGQIRLYTGKQFTRANTAVPGLGAPITSVDVTYDGKWILATTKSYLMVVKTIYKVQPAAAEAAPLTCTMGLLQHLQALPFFSSQRQGFSSAEGSEARLCVPD